MEQDEPAAQNIIHANRTETIKLLLYVEVFWQQSPLRSDHNRRGTRVHAEFVVDAGKVHFHCTFSDA